jgi:hypothetical protein
VGSPDVVAVEVSSEGPPEALPEAGSDAAPDAPLEAPPEASSGPGMLSGVVIDMCDSMPLDALVGIAGHHMCSFQGKGSYFFSNLPLGMLELAVSKTGYDLYDVAVDVVPGGVVHQVALVRTGGGADGCGVPRPTQVACTCQAPTCLP